MTQPYADDAENPDGITQNAPGGGFMWDGRFDTLAEQALGPLQNPVEMNSTPASVVAAIQNGSYAALFQQVYGANVFSDTNQAFADVGDALEEYQTEETSFQPYSSLFDLVLSDKVGGTFTAAEQRGYAVFEQTAQCNACHYEGANFDGSTGLMTDFTYQAIGVPRNDSSIPNNPDPIPANDPVPAGGFAQWYDLGICGPVRTDHLPAGQPTPWTATNAANDPMAPFCGVFKVPTLRNVATRNAFFHNGVFHSLEQVIHFYNTRDTNPEYWYPSSGGTGTAQGNPSWALQPTYVPGATVQKFNDLPTPYQGNIDEELPAGTGIGGDNTLGSGTQPRAVGSTPLLTDQDIADLVCFLNTLTDGYQATTSTSSSCVN